MYGGGAEDEELNTSGSVNLVEESDVGMSGGRGRGGKGRGGRGGRRTGAGAGSRGGRDSTGAGSRRGGKGGFAGLIGQAVLPFGLLTLQQRMAAKSRRATRGGKGKGGKGKGGRKTRRHYRGRKGGDVA
jgi:hypothetical protein